MIGALENHGALAGLRAGEHLKTPGGKAQVPYA